jgi:hypothetical protein
VNRRRFLKTMLAGVLLPLVPLPKVAFKPARYAMIYGGSRAGKSQVSAEDIIKTLYQPKVREMLNTHSVILRKIRCDGA